MAGGRGRGSTVAAFVAAATIAGLPDAASAESGLLNVHVEGGVAGVLPGVPRAGIAGTSFAASVAAAVAGDDGVPVLVLPGDDAAFLAPHPARFLTRDPEIRARIARFGLRTIGSVAALPRSARVGG